MAPNHDQQYDPVPPIPTYDEAVAAGSSTWHNAHDDAAAPAPIDDPRTAAESSEGQSLLTPRHAFDSSSAEPTAQPTARGARRPPRGYRPPTVETDDESNLFGSSSDSDSDSDADAREAAHVRREMQELEIDDSHVHGARGGARSSWGKRIGLTLSLPQWRWRWRAPLSRLAGRMRAGAGRGGGAGAGDGGDGGQGGGGEQTAARRFAFPKFGSRALFLIVGRTLAVLIVLGFMYLLFMGDLFSNMARRMGQPYDPESVRMHVQSSVDPRRIRDHLKHFTSYAHLAGTAGDFALMEDTEMLFRTYGLEGVTRDVYHVYLNYPTAGGRAVEILGDDGRPTWSAKLEEEDIGGATAGRQTYAFHGHSKSGDVKGPLVYANYGSRHDFQALKDMGIPTKGAIALVRYGGSEGDPALKVKGAEMAGFAGCLIYTDPADNGFVKGQTAPKGRFMPADGVQRGAVSLTSWVVGDVLTPGWGSKDNLPRMKTDQTKGLVKIPSLPLAWRDAQVLLTKLKGAGQPAPAGWAGAFAVAGLYTGDGSSPIVRLKNEQDEVEKQPIWNVYGRITGLEQDEKKIIIGNHRDSWAFGAADPHSGTAVMLEVIRIMGDLVSRGWRPARTIEFMSWDGEEYNLIGSTEYVEHNDAALRRDALAYINLDTAVTGDSFRAAGSPVFNKLLLQILNRVSDPHRNTTLRELWDRRKGELEGLGTASDYVAFQDIVGTSSLDLHFDGGAYPHHSNYANFEWMERVGDPGFVYHTLLGQILGLLILELADRPVMPFDLPAYADSLARWANELESWTKQQGAGAAFSLAALTEASNQVAKSVRQFAKWEADWENNVVSTNGWEPSHLGRERYRHNARMAKFETDLLDLAGIPGRTQFKHVVFGPQLWSGHDDAYFPFIRDAVASGNWTRAQLAVDKAAAIITQAAANLISR
ncbi:Zn-dependent exopeptidase [Trichocladium antarcticum]|uniref:Zn-dependent exopeptidase n=1 Tax=Trichocladium antarcticum TaxID=1450529 RepID=A0AAN6UMF8_9PEZI|nr:Zn-dependent exopeptidase [Trichocladium antarcticum]